MNQLPVVIVLGITPIVALLSLAVFGLSLVVIYLAFRMECMSRQLKTVWMISVALLMDSDRKEGQDATTPD